MKKNNVFTEIARILIEAEIERQRKQKPAKSQESKNDHKK